MFVNLVVFYVWRGPERDVRYTVTGSRTSSMLILMSANFGDSFDTSQAEGFVTAKGLIGITGSPALVFTAELIHCTT
jgi:hypothetical protein